MRTNTSSESGTFSALSAASQSVSVKLSVPWEVEVEVEVAAPDMLTLCELTELIDKATSPCSVPPYVLACCSADPVRTLGLYVLMSVVFVIMFAKGRLPTKCSWLPPLSLLLSLHLVPSVSVSVSVSEGDRRGEKEEKKGIRDERMEEVREGTKSAVV
jgi:hypothetical protein